MTGSCVARLHDWLLCCQIKRPVVVLPGYMTGCCVARLHTGGEGEHRRATSHPQATVRARPHARTTPDSRRLTQDYQ